MYITDFICTYKKFEDEKDLFFYVKNDTNGKKILETLFENKDKYPILGFLLTQTNEKNNLEKMKEFFFILFSYELFDLFHNCLIDLFNKNKISDENTNNLINVMVKTTI